eukprot:g2448.t1
MLGTTSSLAAASESGASSSSGRFYGKEGFQPRRILTQMLVLQSGWYLVFCSATAFVDSFLGIDSSGWQFFYGSNYTFDTDRGTVLICSHWVCSLFYAPFLSIVVVRAKKVLDFCVTVQFWHLLFCLLFEFPPLSWWGVALVGCVLGTLLSEAICMRWELEDISLGGGHGAKSGASGGGRNNKYSPVATNEEVDGSGTSRSNGGVIGKAAVHISVPDMPDTPGSTGMVALPMDADLMLDEFDADIRKMQQREQQGG